MFRFCKYAPPGCFFPYTIPLSIGLKMFRFSTRIFYRVASGFITDCACGAWCCELTTCLLYVGPRFGNLVWYDKGFASLTWWRTIFSLYCLSCFTYIQFLTIWKYFIFVYLMSVSQIMLYSLHCTSSLILHRRSFDTFYSNGNTFHIIVLWWK